MSAESRPQIPTSLGMFLVFGRIGLTSFGGGLSGWFLREFVQRRAWLSEEEFLNGLALSQAFPGVNIANLAIWIGYRLRGTPGAIAALGGIIGPPAVFIVVIAMGFEALNPYPVTHAILAGAAAAAIGLSLSMAITTLRRVPRNAVSLAITLATFLAVALLRWPLPWVVLGYGSVSVGLAYRSLGRS